MVLEKDVGYLTIHFWRFCCGGKFLKQELRKRIATDKFIRFENLENDFFKLTANEVFGLDKDTRLKIFTFDKRNSTMHKRYNTYYSEESIELVKHKEKFILDYFGYDFEEVSE